MAGTKVDWEDAHTIPGKEVRAIMAPLEQADSQLWVGLLWVRTNALDLNRIVVHTICAKQNRIMSI